MIESKRLGILGVYLLPNLFTIGAMFAGFYSVVSTVRGQYAESAVAIFVAFFMDGLDGRIARLLDAQSAFGVQLDSLSDMVSFGIAPALVVYSWSLEIIGRTGWLSAFFYMVCSALRLARFNVQIKKIDGNYFQGLPAPPAAALMASIVWVCGTYNIKGGSVAFPMMVTVLFLGMLMVSTVRYRSFKNISLYNRISFMKTLGVALILTIVMFSPSDILLVLSFLYVIFGPIETLRFLYKKRFKK
ncbi:CDP-diacylglycerol--serine O-phosphatidyltransferase [Coxiella endosymbiont of Amblyomma sculptum]|uniref:CDP-diacylglycerol--serine O-phosphatidyltransferase n=1 Tax=Coxiella endosymbiont of Amblyomma sculptum TaxID=2487929 RepID=UPI00132E8C31|nr:CDP-diacylglycerol--serine O-phosphatidyltransferase [Coxiella endosymbiont of Amblyomma sculptum]QHG92405.1 CDP-diacylglycerol--serine O-phosphatidyltransferase [Coxiella endosymbiont of Amblyomma sculptum]